MHVIEHHIQREIIDRLMRAESLRFKDLKPDGMESNIFMYHLKQLIKQKYIAKTEAGYILAFKGLTYVDNINSTNRKPQPQPKLIAIITVRDPRGRWLMVQRKIQPFINNYMLISGQQHRNETVGEHVTRELEEKLKIAAPYTYRGQAEILLHDITSGLLLTHVVGQVFEVKVADNVSLPPDTDHFQYIWIDDPLAEETMMPGTEELIRMLETSTGPFFFSYNTNG